MADLNDRAAAFAFWKLVEHLQLRTDVQNIEQMILAGFCRNCLSKWYHVGAAHAGLSLSYEAACEKVYGMPYSDWKKAHQSKASEEQLRRLEETKEGHAKHETAPTVPAPSTTAAEAPAGADQLSGAASLPPTPPVAPRPLLSDVCCTPADLLVNQPVSSVAQPTEIVHIRLGVLTVSDRASSGEYEDLSGPEVLRVAREYAKLDGVRWRLSPMRTAVVPDEKEQISAVLREWSGADGTPCNLILTTGGTGLSPRDVTPEATSSVLDRPAPGIPELMMREAIKIEPLAALSRAAAGTRGRTLIVNLPGRPQAVRQNLHVLMPLLAHSLAELAK